MYGGGARTRYLILTPLTRIGVQEMGVSNRACLSHANWSSVRVPIAAAQRPGSTAASPHDVAVVGDTPPAE
jgi:hypothetical protein